METRNPCILTRFIVEQQSIAELKDFSSVDHGGKIVLDVGVNDANDLASGEDEMKDLADGEDEMKTFWLCQLQGDDVELVGNAFVEVNGLDATFYDEVQSGETTLTVKGAVIDPHPESDGTRPELLIPERSKPILGIAADTLDAPIESEGGNFRRKLLQGTRSVLVVRVESTVDNSSTTLDEAALSHSVFTDPVNLKTQISACSHGKLNFEPATGTTITNGVTTVQINIAVNGTSRFSVANAAEAALTARFGDLPSNFHHVMYCLPPGATSPSGSW